MTQQEKEKNRFDLCIDHPILTQARISFDQCLKQMIAKAIETGSDEGTATLKLAVVIPKILNQDTNEWEMKPTIKFKAGYSVPMKSGCDGIILEKSTLVENGVGGFLLVNDQISMDELLEE